MLNKKTKLSILAVAVLILGGIAFASFSSANDLQGKLRQKFRGPRNVETEQVRQNQYNNYDVNQGRNGLEGPPEPPPPEVSNIGDIEDIPPPSVSNNLAPDIPEPLPDGASNNIGLDLDL